MYFFLQTQTWSFPLQILLLAWFYQHVVFKASGCSERFSESVQDRHRHLPHTLGHVARGLTPPRWEAAGSETSWTQEAHLQGVSAHTTISLLFLQRDGGWTPACMFNAMDVPLLLMIGFRWSEVILFFRWRQIMRSPWSRLMITSRSLNFPAFLCIRTGLCVVFRSVELLKMWKPYDVYLMLSRTVREDRKTDIFKSFVTSSFFFPHF